MKLFYGTRRRKPWTKINNRVENQDPLYIQLYQEIKENIIEGILKPGSKLPSKRYQADERSISINTVENAYNQLKDEGYIISKERQGYFVADLDLVVKPQPDYLPMQEISITKEYPYDFTYQGVDQDFPFGIWKRLTKQAIDESYEDLLRRGPEQGDEGLRESIAEYLYHSRGIQAAKENIIITAGTNHLFQILFGIWGEDDKYGIENPGFERWEMLFKTNRIAYAPLNLDDQGVCRDDVEAAGVNVLCITPSHQFPTGTIMPIQRRLELLDWAGEKRKRWIIEDDYDGEFKYTGKPIPALKSIDRFDRVVYMGNFSNTLSPALRISYMVLPERILRRYQKRLAYTMCPVPTLTQKTVDLFMREGYFMRHVNRMRKRYREKREIILEQAKKIPGMKVRGTEAGLHVVLEWSGPATEEELIHLAKEKGIFVQGMQRFFVEPTGYKGILLGFATFSTEQLAQVMEKLVEAWKEAPLQ